MNGNLDGTGSIITGSMSASAAEFFDISFTETTTNGNSLIAPTQSPELDDSRISGRQGSSSCYPTSKAQSPQ